MILLTACGKEIEDPFPPSKPEWIPKSAVEIWPETGIDAEPGNIIFLEWYPNPETDIDGYALYRLAESDTLRKFYRVAYIALDNPFIAHTEYRDDSVSVNERYDYYLRARDTGGNLSDPSDTLNYKLLIQISSASMLPQTTTDSVDFNPELSWSYSYSAAMEDYALTILDLAAQTLVIRIWFQPTNYTGGRESWIFHPFWYVENGDSTWIKLESGHIYQWRIDMQADYDGAIEHTGSESDWRYFTVK